MNQSVSTVKKNYKNIGKVFLVIGGLIFLYLFILLVTPKPGMPADIKATIDSLTNVNKQLIEHQKQIDSTIAVYEEEVNQIDFQVDHIKEKTTIVREFYHEASQQAAQYTPTQVDSFFKSRYNY